MWAHLSFFPSPFETLVGTAHAITKEAKKKRDFFFFFWLRSSFTSFFSMVFYTHYLNLENFPSVYSLCIIISLVFLSVVCCCCCSILLAQIKRKNFQVSFSSSSCSLVGTVTRLIRSRLLRSRGPHTFCVVGRKTKQNGEKENLCVKERNAHISH